MNSTIPNTNCVTLIYVEGQLPKGSAYLDPEEYNMDKENKTRGSTVKRNVETEEISECG